MPQRIFYDLDIDDQAQRLCRLLKYTRDAYQKRMQDIIAPWGITTREMAILSMLHHKPQPLVITDIARLLLEKPQTMVILLDRMESRGLIHRIRDLPDRRLVRVEATEKGKDIYREAAKATNSELKNLFSFLSADDVLKLEEYLFKLRAKVFHTLDIEYRHLNGN